MNYQLLPWLAMTTTIFLILLGIAFYFLSQKEKKLDYFALFLSGIAWAVLGLPLDNKPLTLIGMILIIVSISNKNKWKENHIPWSSLNQDDKRKKFKLIILLSILCLAGVITFYYYNNNFPNN